MDKRERIKKWFRMLDKRHKNSVEIELSGRYNVTILTVRNMWIYNGKVSEHLLDDVLEVLKKHSDKQDAEHLREKQLLIDAI